MPEGAAKTLPYASPADPHETGNLRAWRRAANTGDIEHGGTTASKGDIDVAFVGEVGRGFAIV